MTLSKIHITKLGIAGPRVVMVHGGAQGSAVGGERNFSNQFKLAEQGWQLVIPDRPGHGQSPLQGWPDDAGKDGEWIAELLGDGAHLVGHSFGGACALNAAARRPEAVRSLTLIEPAMIPMAADNPAVRKFLLRLVRIMFFSLTAARRAEASFRHLGIPDEVSGQADQAERTRLGKALRRIRMPRKPELERQLAAIKTAGIPLLVVTGGWSLAFDISSDRVAAAGGGRHVIIRSPHHFPQIVSDEFNTQLVEFMSAAEAARK